MKIWSDAIKDADGNELGGSGFVLQGAEHVGSLYIEDEDNFISVTKQGELFMTSYYAEDEDNVGTYRALGERYNEDKNVYTRSNGATRYTTSSTSVTVQGAAYTANKLYISTGGVYRELTQTLYTAGSTKTYYTRSNGVYCYETEKVEEPLYLDGGTKTYPLYVKLSKNLYSAGSRVTYPSYKKYTGKLYDAGRPATLTPATVAVENVTALTT